MKTHSSHLHAFRMLLLTSLVAAVAMVQISPNSLPALSQKSSGAVLAYATSMSRSDLLAAANQSRAANGLSALTMNSALNSSAQAKAQHMVNNNYWSHTAPDGTEPWYFFTQAGYDYSTAGENLAYGFATSADTNAGWMNSPSHRANILGNYNDVGFGIINGSSYQGNENTVVVAHYGKLSGASQPAPTNPTPPPASQSAPQPEPQPEQPAPSNPPADTKPADEKETEDQPAPQDDQVKQEEDVAEIAVAEESTLPPVMTGSTSTVALWQTAIRGSLPAIAIISLGIIVAASIGYMLTHRSLLRQAVASGEQFALHHPAFDMTAIMIALLLVAFTTVGQLQ